MGKGVDMVAQHAGGLTVKNTFIEVKDEYFEDDGWDNALQGITRKRQVSEPASAFARQISRQVLGALPEEPEQPETPLPGQQRESSSSEPDDVQEPECEHDPQQPVLGQAWAAGPYTHPGGALMQLAPAGWQPEAPWPQMAGNEYMLDSMMLMQAPMMGMQTQPHVAAQFLPELQPQAQPQEVDLQKPFTAPAMAPDPTVAAAAAAAATAAAPSPPAGLGSRPAGAPATTPPAPPEWAETLTVMMRNLPNRYTQHMLLEEIGGAGFSGTFDFLYLPIDPETNANKGYAFINFVEPCHAWRFKVAYEGQQMNRFNSSKFVSVSPAALQGLEANYAHYSTARCSRGDPSARPLFLREPKHALVPRSTPGAARRGGQRRRNNGRSLVDVAVQKQYEQRLQQPQTPQVAQRQQRMTQNTPYNSMEAAAQEAGDVAKFCPYCGGATQPSYRFCQYCGASQANIGK